MLQPVSVSSNPLLHAPPDLRFTTSLHLAHRSGMVELRGPSGSLVHEIVLPWASVRECPDEWVLGQRDDVLASNGFEMHETVKLTLERDAAVVDERAVPDRKQLTCGLSDGGVGPVEATAPRRKRSEPEGHLTVRGDDRRLSPADALLVLRGQVAVETSPVGRDELGSNDEQALIGIGRLQIGARPDGLLVLLGITFLVESDGAAAKSSGRSSCTCLRIAASAIQRANHVRLRQRPLP